MPERHPLDAAAEWVELVVTDADWDAAAPHLLTGMLSQLVLIRTFEEFVLELAGEGLIHGPAHSSIGQEGGAVGSIIGLTSQDTVNGSHRGHHQFLAKALPAASGTPPPTMAFVPIAPASFHFRCMLPPRPWLNPRSRPQISARLRSRRARTSSGHGLVGSMPSG